MKLQTHLLLLTLSLITFACNSYKILAHEKQPDNKEFYFNSVDYTGRNCSEFFGVIRERKKVLESVLYYNCSSLSPVKVIYNYDDKGKMKSKQYFISVNDDKFQFQITKDEKHLFHIIDNKNQKGNYKNYSSINGFRKATETDSIFLIPALSKIDRHFASGVN